MFMVPKILYILMLLNSAHLAKNLDIYNMILSFQMLLVQVSL